MLKQMVILLSYANIGTLLVPIGIGLTQWRCLSVGLRAGWVAIALYFLLFLGSLTLVLVKSGINTSFINYLVAAVFGGLFAVAYWLILPPGWHRKLIAVLGAVGLLGIVTETLLLNRYQDVSLWSIPLQTVLTTLTVLIYLHYLIRQTKVSLLTLPFFWLSIALLINSILGTIYDALQQPLITSSRDWFMILMCVQLGSAIFCNLLYGVGFYKAKPTKA